MSNEVAAASVSAVVDTRETEPAEKADGKQGDKTAVSRKRGKSYSEDKRFKIFSGSSNRPLAEEVC